MAGGAVGGRVATGGDVAAITGRGRPPGIGGVCLAVASAARSGVPAARASSRDGRTLFVPSADRHLYALEREHRAGRPGGSRPGAPVLSEPLVTPAVRGVHRGGRLLAVHAATGELAWAVPGRGFSAGRAACDGERVYTAAADGFARAHDLRTGREAWSHRMVSGDLHRVTLYSGLGRRDRARRRRGPSGDGLRHARRWKPGTGAPRWTLPGSTMYPPAVVLGDGTALFTTERGVLSRVSLADGGTVWQADLGVHVQNAGLAVAGASAWVVSASGRARSGCGWPTGALRGSLRYTLAQCYSAPAVAGDTLVAGDQDGVVHGIRPPGLARVLPDERVQGAERGRRAARAAAGARPG